MNLTRNVWILSFGSYRLKNDLLVYLVYLSLRLNQIERELLNFICIVILTYNNKGLSEYIKNVIFLFIYHMGAIYLVLQIRSI